MASICGAASSPRLVQRIMITLMTSKMVRTLISFLPDSYYFCSSFFFLSFSLFIFLLLLVESCSFPLVPCSDRHTHGRRQKGAPPDTIDAFGRPLSPQSTPTQKKYKKKTNGNGHRVKGKKTFNVLYSITTSFFFLPFLIERSSGSGSKNVCFKRVFPLVVKLVRIISL